MLLLTTSTIADTSTANNSRITITTIIKLPMIGCDPSIMGIGPVEAIRGALKAANLTLGRYVAV